MNTKRHDELKAGLQQQDHTRKPVRQEGDVGANWDGQRARKRGTGKRRKEGSRMGKVEAVVVKVASDDGDELVFIAKPGVGISEAAELGELAMGELREAGYAEGRGDVEAVTAAFLKAGFTAPAYLTLEARW